MNVCAFIRKRQTTIAAVLLLTDLGSASSGRLDALVITITLRSFQRLYVIITHP